MIVSRWKNNEKFPSSQCYSSALATDHTRPHEEMINLINPKLPVEHVSLTLISRQQPDTSKGLCYIMRACDMFKTVHQCAHLSTLWGFVYAKEETCSSQPECLMLKLTLKCRNYNIIYNRNVFYTSIICALIIRNKCAQITEYYLNNMGYFYIFCLKVLWFLEPL